MGFSSRRHSASWTNPTSRLQELVLGCEAWVCITEAFSLTRPETARNLGNYSLMQYANLIPVRVGNGGRSRLRICLLCGEGPREIKLVVSGRLLCEPPPSCSV